MLNIINLRYIASQTFSFTLNALLISVILSFCHQQLNHLVHYLTEYNLQQTLKITDYLSVCFIGLFMILAGTVHGRTQQRNQLTLSLITISLGMLAITILLKCLDIAFPLDYLVLYFSLFYSGYFIGHFQLKSNAQIKIHLSQSLTTKISPHFHALASWKLALFYICTAGLYDFVWWYRHWKTIRVHTDDCRFPLIRSAITFPFYQDFIDHFQTISNHQLSGKQKKWLIVLAYGKTFCCMTLYSLILLDVGRLSSINLLHSILLIKLIYLLGFALPIQRRINQASTSTLRANTSLSNFSNARLVTSGVLIGTILTSLMIISFLPKANIANYYFSIGDQETAKNLFEQSTSLPSKQAKFNLGYIYLTEPNASAEKIERGLQLVHQSAEQGFAEAQYYLGTLYQFDNDLNVAQDLKIAASWYQKATDNGHPLAPINLGSMHAKGLDMPQDHSAALKYYELAYQRGDSLGAFNIGDHYLRGLAGQVDYGKALQWLNKTQEKQLVSLSLVDSCRSISLGVMYQNGYGVEKDLTRAKQLYRDAALYQLLNQAPMALIDYPTSLKLYQNNDELKTAVDTMVNYQLDHFNRVDIQHHQHYQQPANSQLSEEQAFVHEIEKICW